MYSIFYFYFFTSEEILISAQFILGIPDTLQVFDSTLEKCDTVKSCYQPVKCEISVYFGIVS